MRPNPKMFEVLEKINIEYRTKNVEGKFSV